jgi:CDP-glucose 4,6-dehydratase
MIRNPDAVRPWQHVLDPLVGYAKLAEALCQLRGRVRTAWNFGPELESMKRVSCLAGTICKVWGGGAAWERHAGNHPHETATLRIDSRRAKTELGWAPRLSYGTAVEWTAGWYRDVFEGADARARTRNQLDAYAELAA